MEGFIVDDDELFKSAVPRILRAQSSSPALLQKQVQSSNILYCRRCNNLPCVGSSLKEQ